MATNEPSLRDAVELGKAAELLMESEFYDRVCDHILHSQLNRIAATEIRDTDTREEAFMVIHGMRMFRSGLTKVVADGKIAADRLAHEKIESAEP